MVGLDWLDLDFFFHHFFQESVPKFEFRRPRMRMGPGPGPGPGPHGTPWGPMGPYGAPYGPTVPLRECRRQFTLVAFTQYTLRRGSDQNSESWTNQR